MLLKCLSLDSFLQFVLCRIELKRRGFSSLNERKSRFQQGHLFLTLKLSGFGTVGLTQSSSFVSGSRLLWAKLPALQYKSEHLNTGPSKKSSTSRLEKKEIARKDVKESK